MPFTSTSARDHVTTATAEAAALGLKVSVAILDAGGNLLEFSRHEDANLATIDIAIQKARTSVFFKAPTRFLTAAMQPGGAIYGAAATSGGLIGIAGGLPITDNGTLIGAIGVSGGTAEQDDQVAVRALETHASSTDTQDSTS
jgi:uncharacterized protein GlcG (DUF336 family)